MTRLSNTVVKAYHEDWKKKAQLAGRLEFQKRATGALARLFKEILGRDLKGKLLDLGCGDGSMTAAFNETEGISAVGIDIGHGVDFESDKLPYADDEFDFALMYSVIEHLQNPGNVLSELRRVLKKNGSVVVITPNFDLTNLFVCCRNFYEDPTHVHPYNLKSIDHVMHINSLNKKFLGLWTVRADVSLWKLPTKWQFFIGAALPFPGNHPWAPAFLKGHSKTMLGVFENGK